MKKCISCRDKKQQLKSCDCKRIIQLKQVQIQKLRSELKFLLHMNQAMANKNTVQSKQASSKENSKEFSQKIQQLQQSKRVAQQSFQQQLFFMRKSNESLNESLREQIHQFQKLHQELRNQIDQKQSVVDQTKHEVKILQNSITNLHHQIDQLQDSNTNLRVALMKSQVQLGKQIDAYKKVTGQIQQLVQRKKQPKVESSGNQGQLVQKIAELSRENIQLRRREDEYRNTVERLQKSLREVNQRQLQYNRNVYGLKTQLSLAKNQVDRKQQLINTMKRELLGLRQINRLY